MTCHEAEAQLDLLAAGECDRPTRQAVEGHLDQCPACAASYAESRRLLALLDLHWDEAGPQRLRKRIEEEGRRLRRERVVLPFFRRAAALAAMCLVTLGLGLLLPRATTAESGPDLQLAALTTRGDLPEIKAEPLVAVRTIGAKALAEKVESVAMAPGPDAMKLKHDLAQAREGGKLPLPPAVPLALALTNAGARTLEVRLGDASSELALEVRGPGVVRVPAPDAAEPEFLRRQTVRLAPGERHVLHVGRLVDGARDRLEYVYLTEPGDYTLTARWRVTAGGEVVTVPSEPIRVRVRK
jgi:hypothetical protein